MRQITFDGGTTIINQGHSERATAPRHASKFIDFTTRKALREVRLMGGQNTHAKFPRFENGVVGWQCAVETDE